MICCFIVSIESHCRGGFRTPSDECQPPQVLGVGQEGHEDEAVEVQPLHQDPVVVGGQEVDEEQHRDLTSDLRGKQSHKPSEDTCCAETQAGAKEQLGWSFFFSARI